MWRAPFNPNTLRRQRHRLCLHIEYQVWDSEGYVARLSEKKTVIETEKKVGGGMGTIKDLDIVMVFMLFVL